MMSLRSQARLMGAALLLPIAGEALAAPPAINVLHSFHKAPDGANPAGPLFFWRGKLWGTTVDGGSKGYGSVFSTDLATGQTHIVYSFTNGADGGLPYSRVVAVGDTLYGTTSSGGAKGQGTIFAVTPGGQEQVLHSFAGSPDGAQPQSGLTLFGGLLYGVTSNGGPPANGSGAGCGIAYTLDPASGAYKKLAAFSASLYDSNSDLIAVGDALYGLATAGGTQNSGAIYRLTKAGRLTTIYSFSGAIGDVADPGGSLIYSGGSFYGESFAGGAGDQGTVFAVSESGEEKILYSFGYGSDAAEPSPFAGLVKVGNRFWGTTPIGGDKNFGAVFSVTATGVETVVSFDGVPQGDAPQAPLIDVDGTLYGTAEAGGNKATCGGYGCGTVFSLKP